MRKNLLKVRSIKVTQLLKIKVIPTTLVAQTSSSSNINSHKSLRNAQYSAYMSLDGATSGNELNSIKSF